MRIWSRSLLLYLVKTSGIYYASPVNFNYWFNFGFLSLYFLISQLITGIIIAMFYNANSFLAFGLILDMSNEIYYGWWLRYIMPMVHHFFFFVFIYICVEVFIMVLLFIQDNIYEYQVQLYEY
jgi:quinol-cytochrome oxidoreductase complex cytochrome b subunit